MRSESMTLAFNQPNILNYYKSPNFENFPTDQGQNDLNQVLK